MIVSRRDSRPLWMRGAGVHLERVMPGRQIAWCLQSTGTWWAIVDIDVSSANGLSRLVLQTWVRAEHVQLDTAENRARAGLAERRLRG